MTFEQFEEFLMSEKCYRKHDVSIIDKDGLQHYYDKDFVEEAELSEYYAYCSTMAEHLAKSEVTIKIEQMEKHWKFDDRTIHLFYNPKNGPTFDKHTDPVDVIIECKDGLKSMWVEGKEITLRPGDKLSIRTGTEHKALNHEKALMASHGIGDTETLNRICEDNGDVQS